MKIKGKFEIGIEDFADSLADACDVEQAEFFNIFFKALRINCGTSFKYDYQLVSIDQKLNNRSKEAIKFLTFDDGEL